jgi:GGDEF domain-containing protein
MDGSTIKPALPGLGLGALGLATGVFGLLVDSPAIGFIAGALAMAAGVTGLALVRQFETQAHAQTLIENELQAKLAQATEPKGSWLDGSTEPPSEPAAEAKAETDPGPVGEATGQGESEAETPSQHRPQTETGSEADTRPEADTTPEAETRPEAGTPPEAETRPEAGIGAQADPEPPKGGNESENALVDPQTGLFSQDFFQVALDSRIAAARRHLRPVAMALIQVVRGLPADEPQPVDASLVARVIKETLREADTACRLDTGNFALLLEDTPENGAIWTIERIRRQLTEEPGQLTVWAGVACYPAHAFTPEKLVEAAELALTAARDWRQDRIEVAAATD